jgi:hypothetical protein
MTQFAMTRDVNGYNSFGLVPAANKFNTILAATVAQTFTVPLNTINPTNNAKWVAIFSVEPGASVWFAHNTTATLPSGSVASTVSELNPTVWEVEAGDTISAITNNATAEIGVKFYAV